MINANFREACSQDVSAIAELENKCFDTPWSRESLEKDINENDLAHYILCEVEGEPAGYAGIWFIGDEGHINNVCISPQYRRKGLASALIARLIEICKEQGVFKMTLEVRKSNQPAIELYEKHGFQEVGVRPKYYQDNGEDAVIMWR